MRSTRGSSSKPLTNKPARKPGTPRLPQASTPEYRRPIFAVGRRHVMENGTPIVATSKWGGIKVVRGGATQRHRDLLDVLRTVAQYRIMDEAHQEHLIFDAAEVRKMMRTRTDWRDIKDMLTDLAATVIQLDNGEGQWGGAFPIVTFIGDANSRADRAEHQYQARLKRVVLSAGFSRLIEEHASISISRETLSRVLSLQHAVSRAVARWCLSHSTEQHHQMANVLAAVGAIAAGEGIEGREARRGVRKYRQHLADDAVGLAGLGVEIDGTTLHYHRLGGVFIHVSKGVELNPAVNGETAELNPAVVELNPAVF